MPGKTFLRFPLLKTQRLILRQLVPDDVNEIYILRSDENNNRYLDRKSARSIEDAKKFVETINAHIQNSDSLYWGITLAEKDQLIGTVCLFDFSEDKSIAEIGYELLGPFQGRGLMQEAVTKVIEYAFRELQLQALQGVSHSKNLHSNKLLLKFNFRQEKTIDNGFIIYRLENDCLT